MKVRKMNFTAVLKRVIPFCSAVSAGTAIVLLFSLFETPLLLTLPSTASSTYYETRFGRTGLFVKPFYVPDLRSVPSPPAGRSIPSKLISTPRATYTDLARNNGLEGSVLLKVTLLANGNVGMISPVRGLQDGLTEQAIATARKIKFKPKRVNGLPITTTKTIEYTFKLP